MLELDLLARPRAAPTADDVMRRAAAARRAETIRRQVVDLAHDYSTNARTLRLDPEIARHDVAAIIAAWSQVTL